MAVIMTLTHLVLQAMSSRVMEQNRSFCTVTKIFFLSKKCNEIATSNIVVLNFLHILIGKHIPYSITLIILVVWKISAARLHARHDQAEYYCNGIVVLFANLHDCVHLVGNYLAKLLLIRNEYQCQRVNSH